METQDLQILGPLGRRKKPGWPLVLLCFLPEEGCRRPGPALQRGAVIQLSLTSQNCVFHTQAPWWRGGAHPGKEDPNISWSDRNEKRRRGTLQECITAAETGVRENCLCMATPAGFLEEVKWSQILERTVLEGEGERCQEVGCLCRQGVESHF